MSERLERTFIPRSFCHMRGPAAMPASASTARRTPAATLLDLLSNGGAWQEVDTVIDRLRSG